MKDTEPISELRDRAVVEKHGWSHRKVNAVIIIISHNNGLCLQYFTVLIKQWDVFTAIELKKKEIIVLMLLVH